MPIKIMNEQLLYETIQGLLAGEDVTLEGKDFADWADTVHELAKAPVEWRPQLFQSLDIFHRGELTRLLASYMPPTEIDMPPSEEIAVDGYPELPAHIQLDSELAAEACPWLNHYIEFSRHWSPRSYDGYHEACGLWVLSTVAARRVAFHLSGPNYTNLYILLSGISTLYAKSRAARIAIDLLKQAGFDWLRAPARATPQAFVSLLVGEVPKNYDEMDELQQERARNRFGFAAQRGWFFEEFGNGIAAMTQASGYMADFRSLLREFDDCPPLYENATQSRGLEVVKRPYLAMLANLTPSDLRNVASRGAQIWGDGFLARFAFVTPPRQDISDARFPLGERIAPEELLKPLHQWHKRLGSPIVSAVSEEKGSFLPGPTTLKLNALPQTTYYPVDDVVDAMYDYNSALLRLARENNEDFGPYYGRLHEKAMRVAVLLASVSGDTTVRLRHWARGQAIAETWRASLHRSYEQINERSVSEEANLEQRIYKLVLKLGHPSAAEISNYIKRHSTVYIKRVADGMLETGILQVSPRRGRHNVLRYCLPTTSDPLPDNPRTLEP